MIQKAPPSLPGGEESEGQPLISAKKQKKPQTKQALSRLNRKNRNEKTPTPRGTSKKLLNTQTESNRKN